MLREEQTPRKVPASEPSGRLTGTAPRGGPDRHDGRPGRQWMGTRAHPPGRPPPLPSLRNPGRSPNAPRHPGGGVSPAEELGGVSLLSPEKNQGHTQVPVTKSDTRQNVGTARPAAPLGVTSTQLR